MSKKIFINNLNTYVSKQLLDTLRNDEPGEDGEPNPDQNVIFGSYIDKDSSEKPAGVKKMLKRSKPRLAMKYLSECDLIVYDLHSGKPDDVRLALDALQKHKGEEGEEKVLILISSLMAWQGTPRKQEEIKTAEQLAAERAEADAAAKEPVEGENPEAEEEPKEPSEKASEEEKQEEQGEDEVEEIIPEKIRKRYRHQPFTELDFKTRDPIEEYQIIKEIEDEVLSFKREGVKCYVISAGILYGNGEAIFNSHFKKAWLQDPLRLPYIGDGNNYLPTIHVKDLAGMVKKVYESKPERKYIFAVDNNKKPTQKKIVSAISNGIGTGLVESIDIPEVFKKAHPKVTPIQLDLDWKKSLLLDLKVTPSSLFISGKEEPAADGEEPGEDGDGDILTMEWHCKSGLPENIQLVKKEFEKQHKHRPVKVLIAGPPAVGKSFFGQQLAEHFNVPHIHMLKLISDLESWDQEKEDKWVKKEAERQYKIDLIRQERAAEKERKRLEVEATRKAEDEDKEGEDAEAAGDAEENAEAKEPPAEGEEGAEGAGEAPAEVKEEPEDPIHVEMDGDSDDDFSQIEIKEKVKRWKESHSGRLPETLINEMVRWRLWQNDCQNRGYVLDGYPRNFNQANEVFVVTPPKPAPKLDEEGNEEPLDEEVLAGLKPTLVKDIYPESVISLNATKQFLLKRSKALQAKAVEDANKWKIDKLRSKLERHDGDNSIDLFKQDNGKGDCLYPTTKFFQDYKTEVFELQADANKYEMFESMRVYVERFGRPYNYLKSMQQLNDEREKYLTEEERQANELKGREAEADAKNEDEKKMAQEKKSVSRLSSVAAHMKELESADELNMRQYAMKYIIPLLTEGMIDVWKVGPLDPVDYLAEYIFKKSGEAQ